MKSKTTRVNTDYRSFLLDYAESGVFPPRSKEVRIIRLVASQGLERLDFEQAQLWYERILPILSKPMSEQILISAIKRNGGRVPRRVDSECAQDDLHPFKLDTVLPRAEDEMGDGSTDPEFLLQVARALRAGPDNDQSSAPPST